MPGGGAFGYFLGRHVPSRTPNCHPILKKNPLKLIPHSRNGPISIAVFCLQNLICLLFIFAYQVFIDPTFSGIFVCGPLQSFVVYVCKIFYTPF